MTEDEGYCTFTVVPDPLVAYGRRPVRLVTEFKFTADLKRFADGLEVLKKRLDELEKTPCL